MKNSSIRLIKKQKEWEKVLKLAKQNFPLFYERIKQTNLEQYTKPHVYLLGKFADDKLLGTIAFEYEVTLNIGSIFLLQTLKEYRRAGIASELFKKVLKIAKQLECEYIYLTVLERNTKAIAIYKNWGFKRIVAFTNLYIENVSRKACKNHKIVSKAVLIDKKDHLTIKQILSMFPEKYKKFNEVFRTSTIIENYFDQIELKIRYLKGKDYLLILQNYSRLHRYNQVFYSFYLLQSDHLISTVIKDEIKTLVQSTKSSHIDININLTGELNYRQINELKDFGVRINIPHPIRCYYIELDSTPDI